MTAEKNATEWVSVALADGWSARCRVEPRNGRPAIVELQITSDDGDRTNREITVGLLRRFRRTDVLAELARRGRLAHAQRRSTAPELHGRRRDEDILAEVAICYEESAASGSKHPARDVWEFLTQMHEITHDKRRDPSLSSSASDEPWRWGDATRYPSYTRSSVRTLIRRARECGYLLGDVANPRLVDHEWPTLATLARATERKRQFFSVS